MARARGVEPGGNRTLNPQIKSLGTAKTLEIRMILRVSCADRGSGRHPGVTSTLVRERPVARHRIITQFRLLLQMSLGLTSGVPGPEDNRSSVRKRIWARSPSDVQKLTELTNLTAMLAASQKTKGRWNPATYFGRFNWLRGVQPAVLAAVERGGLMPTPGPHQTPS